MCGNLIRTGGESGYIIVPHMVHRNLQARNGCICAKWRSIAEVMALKKVVICGDRKSRKPLGDYMLKPGRRNREKYV